MSDGTGACASIQGYTVAGKTGTSRKAAPRGGYTSGTMASFVGFAPAEQPRFAAIVVLDEPRQRVRIGRSRAGVLGDRSGRADAVPASRRTTPTPSGSSTRARAHAQRAGSNCAVPHGAALQQVLASNARPRRQAEAETSADGGRRPRRRRGGTERGRYGDARYCRRRHVPERVGGRVRMHDLLDGLDVRAVRGDLDVDVKSVVHDSREVAPGALFACIRGAVTDGHAYAAAAVGAGAVGLLVEEELDLPVAAGARRVGARRARPARVHRFFGRPVAGARGCSVSPGRTARRP